MTSAEKEPINRLCLAIRQETDPAKVTKLVAELNAVLERGDGKVNEVHGDGFGH